ncbi:DUF550 domain-containing protein [Salmonella enterica]|uniref:DUF550 domain-containing protein n=1 Tax=Salmonella enterica subsp. enterica serovar Havana TaxID=179997 RepID=A0A3V9E7Z2_SALET|nr:DUF550 domain-containing protein [Salmonella enterica]ECC1930205.1 DUF550 domain-containing protein [Salmonella enterica subsp. enterica serovar Agona]ECS1785488.1 DUF550 domain-containing protein [Salmonella enterica subsp. enterica serovar Braenderup]ECU8107128.1 DUF550 domain-containing protein [Salmonella enterica subsp. enterica serovar Lexington]EDT5092863.1 DUF550 domain-containing protein [Salmonella enterica subsp. enterica]EDV0971182.1 DUF550 domain-containing protein [Salmonella 
MTTITKEWLQQTIAEFENTRDDIPFGLSDDDAKILIVLKRALVSLDAEPVSQPYKLPEEKSASLQLRNLIRKRHAEWSDSTFGNVGPVGPLKHLSKEALEAAAEPGDLSEWADMQFLLWDAQRRAGISDGEITAAMEEKLKVNMARQWPEPKDGEPRLHIKEQPVPVVPAEMPKGLAGQIVSLLAHNIGDKLLAQKIWNACRAAMLQGAEPVSDRDELPVIGWLRSDYNSDDKRDPNAPLFMLGSNDPSDAWGVKYIPLSGNSPVIPGGWVMVPKKLTAENGAKSLLSGEFLETTFISCPECFADEECESCDGSGRIKIEVPVSWTTIKAIWNKGVEHFRSSTATGDN